MNVDEAIMAKMCWQEARTRAYAKALLEAAVRLHIKGRRFFNNDDVAERDQPGDGSTVGAVIRLLLTLHVIERTGVSLPDHGIEFGMRASTREGCNGHRNPLYRLTNTSIALEWLRRNGGTAPEPQPDLFDTHQPATRSAVSAGL